jgi:hypothetical protein
MLRLHKCLNKRWMWKICRMSCEELSGLSFMSLCITTAVYYTRMRFYIFTNSLLSVVTEPRFGATMFCYLIVLRCCFLLNMLLIPYIFQFFIFVILGRGEELIWGTMYCHSQDCDFDPQSNLCGIFCSQIEIFTFAKDRALRMYRISDPLTRTSRPMGMCSPLSRPPFCQAWRNQPNGILLPKKKTILCPCLGECRLERLT